MAATKLISMHQAKGKSPVQSLKERINYSENPDKTEEGEYISSYACSAETAAEEFALSKEEYLRITGRVYKGDILAYQIRQSFKPGEITPEEANKIGYETAMRFTRGEHAFIVCTHTDRAHIHNHIYNTTGASHVGIYVGDGMMIHCGNPIQYASVNSAYFQAHFYCYGRLPSD